MTATETTTPSYDREGRKERIRGKEEGLRNK
jgi:hypothetical protein